jgi:hypothetical protein
MRNSLLLGVYVSWNELKPSPAFVRKTGLMIGMYVALTLGTFAVVRAATAALPLGCSGGQSMIVYPIYNARGVEIDQQYACGKPRKACTIREQTSRGPLYECPGLMRP